MINDVRSAYRNGNYFLNLVTASPVMKEDFINYMDDYIDDLDKMPKLDDDSIKPFFSKYYKKADLFFMLYDTDASQKFKDDCLRLIHFLLARYNILAYGYTDNFWDKDNNKCGVIYYLIKR